MFHVQKFEISPHDRFFLHGHRPCVRDKYEVCLGDEKKLAAKPRTPNTGVDRYILTTRCGEEDGKPELEKIVFDLVSCGRHLDVVSI